MRLKKIHLLNNSLKILMVVTLNACSPSHIVQYGDLKFISKFKNENELKYIYLKEKTILVLIDDNVYIPSCECLVNENQDTRDFGNVSENRNFGNVNENRNFGNVNETRDYGEVNESRDYCNLNSSRNFGNANEDRNYGTLTEKIKCKKLEDGRGFIILSSMKHKYGFYDGIQVRNAKDDIVELH